MCYACTMCNRCGRANEMKARSGRRVCPSCGAFIFDKKIRNCTICGEQLAPPFPDPPKIPKKL